MHKVLVNRLGGLSLPRKSVVRLTDRPDMTLDVYSGRKNNNATTTTIQLLGIEEEIWAPPFTCYALDTVGFKPILLLRLLGFGISLLKVYDIGIGHFGCQLK